MKIQHQLQNNVFSGILATEKGNESLLSKRLT